MVLRVDENVVNINQKLLGAEHKASLEKLPVAKGSSYNSSREANEPRCHPETRKEILAMIKDWALAPDSQTVFWLDGMAGTGKSTISRTISEFFDSSGCLGASFFFKSGEADRGGIDKFFTTIASQLAAANTEYASSLCAVLDANPHLTDKGPQIQYQELIQKPLSGSSSQSWPHSTVLIVIDALDECENSKDIKLILDLFCRAKSAQVIKLRVFVTSRPVLPTRLGFSNNAGTYKDFILHEIEGSIIRKDIMTFLSTEIICIKDDFNKMMPARRHLTDEWPSLSDLETLADMATPLFIFASTFCRFLADHNLSGRPDDKLIDFLAYPTQDREPKPDDTYLSVLRLMIRGLSPRKREEMMKEFRYIVGSIVLLASPLSTQALSELLDLPLNSVESRLDHLHSVLSIPKEAELPVRLFHLSFRDFLLAPDRPGSNEFSVDKAEINSMLFHHCLRIMSARLKVDICGLGAPGAPISALGPERITRHIPPELNYACLYWIHHLKDSGKVQDEVEKIHQFLKVHLLHWAEAMSIVGRYTEAASALKVLQSMLPVGPLHHT